MLSKGDNMGLIEFTTITFTIIGVSIIIVKAINKNTAQAIELKEQFATFKNFCEIRISNIEEVLDEHEGYLVECDKRIWKLEDWKEKKEVE